MWRSLTNRVYVKKPALGTHLMTSKWKVSMRLKHSSIELDSFYKRYSEIKVQNANFSSSKELLDSARENDETFQDKKITRFDVLVHNDQKQQKERGKIQANKKVNQPIPPKHQTKPSIGSYTKVILV